MVLIVGGNETLPVRTPYDDDQALLRALLEGDGAIKVSDIGFNKHGFLVQIMAPKDYAPSIASLCAGRRVVRDYREIDYAFTISVMNSENSVIKPEVFSQAIDSLAVLLNKINRLPKLPIKKFEHVVSDVLTAAEFE